MDELITAKDKEMKEKKVEYDKVILEKQKAESELASFSKIKEQCNDQSFQVNLQHLTVLQIKKLSQELDFFKSQLNVQKQQNEALVYNQQQH